MKTRKNNITKFLIIAIVIFNLLTIFSLLTITNSNLYAAEPICKICSYGSGQLKCENREYGRDACVTDWPADPITYCELTGGYCGPE